MNTNELKDIIEYYKDIKDNLDSFNLEEISIAYNNLYQLSHKVKEEDILKDIQNLISILYEKYYNDTRED